MITLDGILEKTVAGVIGGLIATVILKLIDLFKRPKIDIVFEKKDTYTIAKIGNIPDTPDGLYLHLNVLNSRKSMAYGCKVFLLSLEEKRNNKFEKIDLKTHYVLKWANENEPKGYEGLEIPGNYRRRVDLFHSTVGSHLFLLFIEGGLRGIRNGFGNGEYRFTIQVSGKNTNTVTKKFIVKWDGPFEKENIEIKPDESSAFVRAF
jgi:hypothetical protein